MHVPSPSTAGPNLACFPAFFLAGMPKCGTSDLFLALSRHPDILGPREKEVHWWNLFLPGKDTASLSNMAASTSPNIYIYMNSGMNWNETCNANLNQQRQQLHINPEVFWFNFITTS